MIALNRTKINKLRIIKKSHFGDRKLLPKFLISNDPTQSFVFWCTSVDQWCWLTHHNIIRYIISMLEASLEWSNKPKLKKSVPRVYAHRCKYWDGAKLFVYVATFDWWKMAVIYFFVSQKQTQSIAWPK